MRTIRGAAFILLSMISAPVLAAQSPSSRVMLPVPPGARVRVTAPSLVGPLLANYLEMRGDTVVLVEDRAGQGLWSIPYSEIRSLHLSAGMKHNHAPYIARGAAIGGGAGFLLGLAFASTLQPSDTSKKFKRVTSGMVVGAVGAVIGGIVGSRFQTENWVPISLQRRVSVTPLPFALPLRQGALLRVDVAF